MGDANSSVELVDTAAPIGAGSSSGGRLWAYHRGRTIAGRGYAGRGDSLALASGNSAEFLVTYYACAKLGVICVPINLGWRTNEVAYVLGHSCARGIVIESQLLPVLDSALVEVPAVADVIVISYELAAAGERGTTFAQLTEGFDAGRLLELIETERITQIFGLPMMYRQMLDHPDVAGRDLSSLRRALYAMAPMPEAQLRRCLEVFGCEFYLLFGQTEMSPTATLFRPEHQLSHAGAVGTPVANVQVAIMDGGGRLVPQGESGEIVYRGPHTMTEYLHNPAATEAAFAHGWFHSGDVGHFDADGILWFSDRRKDVIKTGGENVASIEVEKAVYAADPDVAEVVVVGLPHDRWGEAITAVVVPRPGARIDERELIDSVKGVIDPYRAPKAVLVVDDLPKTSTGKIQKNAVRDKFAGHYTAGPTPGRRLVEWESRDSRRDERPAPDRGDVSLVDSGGRAHARRWTNRQSGRPGLGRRRCTRPQPRARIHGFAAAAALVVPARA